MPTSEYECKKCSHNFEVFQTMSEKPKKKCPKCGKELRRLIFGGAGVIFKGSGFYVTDKAAGKTSNKSKEQPESTVAGCPAPCSEGCPAAANDSGKGSDKANTAVKSA
jgi:putative FmdB family regulatory protein